MSGRRAAGAGAGAGSGGRSRPSDDRIRAAVGYKKRGHKKRVTCLSWNSTGSSLASASVDHTVKLWSLDSAGVISEQLTLRGHTNLVDQVQWHPTRKDIVATISRDETLKIWDARTPSKPTHTVKTNGRSINLAWRPDGKQLGVSHMPANSKEDHVTLYDPATAGVMKTIKFPYEVNDMVWDSNHCLWFATGQRAALDFGVLECVKFVGKRMSRVYSAAVASQNAFAVALAPDGSKMATGGADGIVTILDTDEMVCTGTLDRLENPVRAISFSADSRYLAVASEDKMLEISAVSDGRRVRAIPTKDSTVAVAWHPKKNILAFTCDDRHGAPDSWGQVHVYAY